MGDDIVLSIQPQMTPEDMARHIIQACAPYTTIITAPEAIRSFLKCYAIDFDDIWIPKDDGIRDLGKVLESFLGQDAPKKRGDWVNREYVLAHLHQYHREFAGFIDDDTEYVVLSMHLNDFFREPPDNTFSMMSDGGSSVVRVIFDLEAGAVVHIECNGQA